MSFLIRVSKPVTGVYYSTFTSKIFSPAGLYTVMILNISDYRNIDYKLFWFDSGSLGLACTIVLLRQKFPNLPLWNVTFQIYKISTMIFFIRFPKPTADTISQLPQNFSRLRRASLSTYVFFFQISKISSISFLLRHIWLTPPLHLPSYLIIFG